MSRDDKSAFEPVSAVVASSLLLTSPPIRGRLLVAFAAAIGAIVGLAAASGAGPFVALRAQSAQAKTPPRVVAAAAELFPSPTPQVIHKTVDMYDPPPARPVVRSAAPAPASTRPPESGGGGGEDDGGGGGGTGSGIAGPTPPPADH